MSTFKPTDLKRRVLRAGSWSIAGYGAAQVIRLASNLVMARLLAPEMFGIMAIALTAMMVMSMISDIGLSHSIVQNPRGDDPAFLDTAWTVQVVRGFLLWFAALGLSAMLLLFGTGGSGPGGSVYHSEVLPAVVAVSAFAAVISGFQSTKMASALRRFDQRRLVQMELISYAAGLVVMIGIGVATRSIWALVIGGLVSNLSTAVLSHAWLPGHRNRWRCERKAFKELLGFGKWLFLSSTMSILALQGDRLLLGAFVDAQTLGLYAIAALILGALEGALARLLTAVALPALSEIARNDPSRLREVYYQLRLPGDIGLLFIAGFLFATGQLVIDVLYDPRYSAAGGMLRILALSLIALRYAHAYQIYIAVGKPSYLAFINVARCAALFISVPVLNHFYGIEAAIWGIALHGLAMLPFVYGFNAKLGINDLRRELIVLPVLPVGYACGALLNLLQG